MEKTSNFEKHTTKNPIGKIFLNRFNKTLIKAIKNLHATRILDVGCGEGFTLQRLRKENIGKHLEGVDTLETAIEIGKKLHPHLTLRKGNIYKLPYKDNSFDIVICSEVLEHLENPEKALQELIRVSKKHIVLSVPNEPLFSIQRFLRGKNIRKFGDHPEHIQHWSTKKFKKFVEKYLRIVAVKKPTPWTLVIGVK